MDLLTWTETHADDDGFGFDPYRCRDEYDRVAETAAWRVGKAWRAWESTVGEDDPALPEWLALLSAIDEAEHQLANVLECACYECGEAAGQVKAYRADAVMVAGEWGLPRPPAEGRIPRYPVNVGSIREKAARLASSGKVWVLTEGEGPRDIYIVEGDTGNYYVSVRAPDPLTWECSCPWGQPQGKRQRPGRGCAHALAVGAVRARPAMGARAA